MEIRPQPASSVPSLPAASRGPQEPSQEPGLLLVQVDGVSHDHLQQALDEGLMPNLKRRLEEGKLTEAPWHSGLPSQTVVVQGGVLFGKSELPGNQWLDKSTGQIVNAVSLESADEIEERLSRDNGGLVQGGTAYMAPVSGQADDSFFIISELARVKEEKGTSGALKEAASDAARLSGRLWQHPVQAARSVGRLAHDFATRIRERKAEGREAHGLKEKVLLPLQDSFADTWLTDAATAHMAKGLEQGKPVLYVDLANFDGMSHAFGPGQAAFETLRDVDRNLGTLFQAVDQADRPYHVCVFSDHGQARAIPFMERYGQTLQEYTQSLLPAGQSVVVQDIGSAAHLYFPGQAGSLDRDQLDPKVLDTLRNHEAIAFTVARQDGATLVEGKLGSVRIDGNGAHVTGQNPLAGWGSDEGLLARQMHDMAYRKDAGDLMVFGVQEGDGLISFNVTGDGGLHGGLGLSQDEPFVAWSPELSLHPETTEQGADLHDQLYPYVPKKGPASA